MKCKHCNSVISDDSVFCENCGAKVEKKSILKCWIIGGVVVIGLVVGILAIVSEYRWADISQREKDHWPPCTWGKGTWFSLQDGDKQSLIRVKLKFPIWIEQIADVNGKIYGCQGANSGLKAFALLDKEGRITFVTDNGEYTKGFLHIGGAAIWCSDENHIYGVMRDDCCGEYNQSVQLIFPYGYGQPVRTESGWRYIDLEGRFIFEDEFDDAYPFCYGKARVCKNGRWYYIDGNNHELDIHNDYDKNVTYKVLEGEDFHYDDNKQKVVAKMRLKRYIHPKVIGNDYWALVDDTGKIVESSK